MTRVVLDGPRADSPMGVLVALGTLSLLTRYGHPEARLGWTATPFGHRPTITTTAELDLAELSRVVAEAIDADGLTDLKQVADDLNKVMPEDLRGVLSAGPSPSAALLTGLASALPLRPAGQVAMSPLCIVSFKGRRSVFDAIIRQDRSITAVVMRGVLGGPWVYERDQATMGLDPAARRADGALMGPDASADGTRGVAGSLSLATRGLSLVPPLPARGRRPHQGAFAESGFAWPVWEPPLPVAAVRMLMGRNWQARAKDPAQLRGAGMVGVYRSRIVEAKDGRRLARATRVA